MVNSNSYLRFYADGNAVLWDDRPTNVSVPVWARFKHDTITFNDWDANLLRHGPKLGLKGENEDWVFYRLPHNLQPPKGPNHPLPPGYSGPQ